MARFDVYRPTGLPAQLVVDVQTDVLSELESRIVVPLRPFEPKAGEHVDRLMPVLDIDGQAFLLVTTDLGMVPTRILGQATTNVEAQHRDTITAAMDFLVQGF